MPGPSAAIAVRYEHTVEEVEYLRHGDFGLTARIHRPAGDGPFPAVVDMHGGAWCLGTRANNDTINEALARRGVVVAAVDFRMPPVAGYPGSVADVNYAIRWLKRNAERFATRPGWIGTTGTSSGGHLAVLAALKPDDPRYRQIAPPDRDEAVNARVPFVVTLWPVICPLGRYRYMQEQPDTGDTPLSPASAIAHQDSYWGSEEAMADGSPRLALERGDPMETPDILYVQATGDPLHPREFLDRFVAGYRRAGGSVEVEIFEHEAYDAPRTHPDAATSVAVLDRMADFIRSRTSG